MPIRKRSLKPDSLGRYRPYLGYRVDGKQQRFNLGTDKAEAERRLHRLYELWAENVQVAGVEVWSPLALSFAKQVAQGKRKIEYPFLSEFLEANDPAAEYTQVVHVERHLLDPRDKSPTRSHEEGAAHVRSNRSHSPSAGGRDQRRAGQSKGP